MRSISRSNWDKEIIPLSVPDSGLPVTSLAGGLSRSEEGEEGEEERGEEGGEEVRRESRGGEVRAGGERKRGATGVAEAGSSGQKVL